MSDRDATQIVADNSIKILELLKSRKSLSSWDIKLTLKVSSSELYLSLGYLLAEKKINISLTDFVYRIELNSPPELEQK
ncbi:MAG: hypothetical protein KA059_09055 [Elusimicrobiales bacterium]|jgi:hypothetical protein|nr:hypothetical protein [Elusimicrobiales bacterium]